MEQQELRVEESKWLDAMDKFLNEWRPARKAAGYTTPSIPPYRTFVDMVHVGKTVLDVGCGSCAIRSLVPNGIQYYGIGAFPIKDIEGIRKGKIEDIDFKNESYDTIFCFAVLDNVQDLTKTLTAINHMARQNVAILTGIGIDPNKYHTLFITEEALVSGLPDFEVKLKHQINEKLFLYDFHRKGIAL